MSEIRTYASDLAQYGGKLEEAYQLFRSHTSFADRISFAAGYEAGLSSLTAERDALRERVERLNAERNLFKGKYRAMLKLISRTRDKLGSVTDHIEDEGDRRYFGSTNDADALKDIFDKLDMWVWDAVDETNRMKSDPYADIREQRARAEAAEARVETLETALKTIAEDASSPQAMYDRNGPQWTSPRGNEYEDTSAYLAKCNELADVARTALSGSDKKDEIHG